MPEHQLLPLLSPDRRLALAYATGISKPLFLGLFALDGKLQELVRAAREPMLGQIKLAWWREQLGKPPGERAKGEPVLAALDCWGAYGVILAALTIGWEHRLGEAPLGRDGCMQFAKSRGDTCAGLAGILGASEAEARCAAEIWALGDLFNTARNADEQHLILQIWRSYGSAMSLRDSNMRPLLILAGLSGRTLKRPGNRHGVGSLLLAMRLGMFGI